MVQIKYFPINQSLKKFYSRFKSLLTNFCNYLIHRMADDTYLSMELCFENGSTEYLRLRSSSLQMRELRTRLCSVGSASKLPSSLRPIFMIEIRLMSDNLPYIITTTATQECIG